MSRRVELAGAAVDARGEPSAPADAGVELDGLLLEVMSDPTHPRHGDANEAWLLRHGAAIGFAVPPDAPAPPRTIVEWNVWRVDAGLPDA